MGVGWTWRVRSATGTWKSFQTHIRIFLFQGDGKASLCSRKPWLHSWDICLADSTSLQVFSCCFQGAWMPRADSCHQAPECTFCRLPRDGPALAYGSWPHAPALSTLPTLVFYHPPGRGQAKTLWGRFKCQHLGFGLYAVSLGSLTRCFKVILCPIGNKRWMISVVVTWEVLVDVCAQLLCCVQLFVTLWTVACQAPLSMEFSRQE